MQAQKTHNSFLEHPDHWLQWLDAMGVDDILSNTPHNRMQAPAEMDIYSDMTESNTPSVQPSPPATAQLSIAQHIAKARELAEQCNSLDALRQAIESIDFISIKNTAMHTVFGDGQTDAPIMLIGEAPGSQEDKTGRPFSGEDGTLLDTALSHIGLSRDENCYYTNSIFWRPPGNRRPTPEEMQLCLPFLEKHIALIKPSLLILVGATSANMLLNEKKPMMQLRGKFNTYSNRFLEEDIETLCVFHPSFLQRKPLKKKDFWKDLQSVNSFLKEKKILQND